MATLPDVALDAAEFDAATELAVRHFQQVRGLSVDGRVGEETYRALNEARWSLGDRLLRYDPERPIRGDDVISLQERLHELGYDAGPVDGVFGPETETGLRAFQRDYGLTVGRHVRAGHAARAAPARPQGHRRAAAAAAAERLVRRERPAPHRPADRRRPGPRRRRDRASPRARRPRPTWSSTSPPASRAGWPPPARPSTSPAAATRTRRRRERTAFANDARADLFISLHMDSHRSEHARGVASLLLRHRVGGVVHGRRAVRQPRPPRGRRPHRHARPGLAPQDVGPAADDPDAGRPAGLRLPLPPGRPAAAARRPGAQRHRARRPGRRPAALPARRGRPPDGDVHAARSRNDTAILRIAPRPIAVPLLR